MTTLIQRVKGEKDEVKIEELEQKLEEQNQEIIELKSNLEELNKFFSEHRHTGEDKTLSLISTIQLPEYSFFSAGNAILSGSSINKGTSSEIDYNFLNTGADKEEGVGYVTKNTQIITQHSVTIPSGETFFMGLRPPISTGSTTITTGTSTLGDSTKSWVVDELAGAYISILDSASTLQTLPIASNTSTTITVTGTFTLSGLCTYTTFKPVYLGGANYPWKRAYVTDTSAGGVRFGQGATAGGQNSLLYTVGNRIYFRDTAGTVSTLAFTSEL
jgi:hypothetical protein